MTSDLTGFPTLAGNNTFTGTNGFQTVTATTVNASSTITLGGTAVLTKGAGTAIAFPATSGTLALTSQIPNQSSYMLATSISTASNVVWTVQSSSGNISISGSTISFSQVGFYEVEVSVQVTTTQSLWTTTFSTVSGNMAFLGTGGVGSTLTTPLGVTQCFCFVTGVRVDATAPASINLQQTTVSSSVVYTLIIRQLA